MNWVLWIIGSKISRVVIIVATAVASFYGLYMRGKQEGRKAERDKLKRSIKKEVDNAEAEANRNDRLSEDDVDRDLRGVRTTR